MVKNQYDCKLGRLFYGQVMANGGKQKTKTYQSCQSLVLFSSYFLPFNTKRNMDVKEYILNILSYYHSNTSVPEQDFMSALEFEYEKHSRNLLKLGVRKIAVELRGPTVLKASATKMQISARIAMNINSNNWLRLG